MPLSALCCTQATTSAVGGSFCSTTKVKCVPLPTLHSHHHFTPHTLKNVSLHAERYIPAPPPSAMPPMVSYSLLELGSSRQRRHLEEREVAARKCQSLQRAGQVTPHRLGWAFYMTGEPAQLSNRKQITADELHTLRQLTLSQNPALFYGTGIRAGGSGQISRQVTEFREQFKEAVEELAGVYSYRGRYSDLRTVTPGSPIMELEEADEMATPPPPVQQTCFLTDPNQKE